MRQDQTAPAGDSSDTRRNPRTSYAQITPKKRQEQLELPIGSLHKRLIHDTCNRPTSHPLED